MMRFRLILGLLVFTKNFSAAQEIAALETNTHPLYTEAHQEVIVSLRASLTPLPPREVIIDTVDLWKKWSVVENYTFGKDRGSMPMITELNALHPYFRDKISQLIQICDAKGIKLAIVESYRTHSKQNEYKSMGRKYTRSGGGSSKHQYGLAIDVVPIVDSVAVWDNAVLWRKIGVVGEKLGLRWGGRWKKPYDPGHFEWTGGLNTSHFAAGVYPRVPVKENYPCLEEDIKKLKLSWAAWETEQSSLARKEVSSNKMK